MSEALHFFIPQRTEELITGQKFVLPYEKIAAQQFYGLDLITGATVEEIEEEIEEDIKIEETTYVPTLFGADLSHFREPIFHYYPYRTEDL